MHVFYVEHIGQEQRVLSILDHDQRIALRLFRCDVPGRGRGSGPSADSQTRPLAQRIESESPVFADHLALGGFDRARRLGQVSAQKYLERPLADETDAGAVRFVEYRQSRRVRAPPNLLLTKVADGKQRLGQGSGWHLVQEVTLVFGRVGSLQQLNGGAAPPQTGIMTGGDPRRPQSMHIVEADAELDFAIAQDVGIRSAPRGILVQEMCKYPFAVLGREADPMQRNAQPVAHPPRILKIRGRGAVSVLVIV